MLLKNKKIVIFGVANKYSIATGIARSMHEQGAELAFAYQNERLLKNIKPIAEELGSEILIECDVSNDNSIDQAFKDLTNQWNKFDGLVHSIGFAPADQLEGSFVSLEANTRFLAASMGKDNIRVNAISAGPIKTLAASGVKNFRKMLSQHSKRAPLGRTVTADEVGNVAAFLCSDYASGVTGEITYVDAGFNISAMPLDELEE